MESLLLIIFLVLVATPIIIVLATLLAMIPLGLLGWVAHRWYLKTNKNEMKLYSTITVKMKDTEEFKNLHEIRRAG